MPSTMVFWHVTVECLHWIGHQLLMDWSKIMGILYVDTYKHNLFNQLS